MLRGEGRGDATTVLFSRRYKAATLEKNTLKKSFITASLVLSTLFIASCGSQGEQLSAAGQREDAAATRVQEPMATAPTLQAPAGVSTLSGDGQITINWNKVDSATSYNVYFSNSPIVNPVNGTRAGGVTETSYVHTGLKSNTMYYYIVTAVSASEESLPSGEMGAMPKASPPAVPTGVAASGGDGKITVRWNAVAGARFYNIYCATATGVARAKNGKNIPGIKTTSYQDADVKKKTMYYYVVTAVNDGGESPASGETGAMP